MARIPGYGRLESQTGIDPAPDGIGGENGHVTGPTGQDDTRALLQGRNVGSHAHLGNHDAFGHGLLGQPGHPAEGTQGVDVAQQQLGVHVAGNDGHRQVPNAMLSQDLLDEGQHDLHLTPGAGRTQGTDEERAVLPQRGREQHGEIVAQDWGGK